MNWAKVILGGVVAGIVVSIADWVMHGVILSKTYMKYAIFVQEEDPKAIVWFFVIAILISFFVAILFSKTRACWADGAKGGATFGFWIGMVAFFSTFYNPLVLEGFPYFLSWCWGGIHVIEGLIGGTVLGLIIKRA